MRQGLGPDLTVISLWLVLGLIKDSKDWPLDVGERDCG